MPTEELKCCPFCGSGAITIEFEAHVYAHCGDCGGMWFPCFPLADTDIEETKRRAADLWNERANLEIRRWERGSEPPDGFYIARTGKGIPYTTRVVNSVENGRKILNAPALTALNNGGVLYGPLPEPEEA
jgi:site-specific DNA-adenine methylase